MLCVFLVFCSLITSGGVPADAGQVSQWNDNVYLAHNYLDGKYFSELNVGEDIHYYDGVDWNDYVITEVIEAPASDPYSQTTALLVYGEWRSPYWVHQNIYNLPDTIVLQTCVEKDGNQAWGRLFIIAERQQNE